MEAAQFHDINGIGTNRARLTDVVMKEMTLLLHYRYLSDHPVSVGAYTHLLLQVIENTCIQDFMYHGIHLPRTSPVHTRVREVSGCIHRAQILNMILVFRAPPATQAFRTRTAKNTVMAIGM